ncbi:MAG: NAD(+)/NADH kinase [Candidatus Uhrbacteria bacterium]
MDPIRRIVCVHADSDRARSLAEHIGVVWKSLCGDNAVITLGRLVRPCDTTQECADRERDRGLAIFAVGGDGFLLEVVRTFSPLVSAGSFRVPIVGWNAGQVGFLMNDPAFDAQLGDLLFRDQLRAFAEGRYEVQQCDLLDAWWILQAVSGERAYAIKERAYAFNEIRVERAVEQAARLDIAVDGVSLGTYSGDGLILASSQGSTAYALSAGGPVVDHSLPAMVIVPNNPARIGKFLQLTFPLVLAPSREITITVCDAEKRPVRVVADGCVCGGGGIRELHVSMRFGEEDARTVNLLYAPDGGRVQQRFPRRVAQKFFGRG